VARQQKSGRLLEWVVNHFTLLEENVTVSDSLFREAKDGFREVK